MNKKEVMCPYCNIQATLKTSKEHYGVDYGRKIYVCKCGATIGTHGNTNRPLGTMANERLRKLRMMCHGAFDVLWRTKIYSRTHSYVVLKTIMGIEDIKYAHISMFDEQQCITFLKRFPYYLEKYVFKE